jgi:transposase
MKKIPKQEYTAEFKELAVKRVKAGQTVGVVAKELGLIDQTLRNWVKAAAAGKLNGAGAKVVTPEEMEFSRLRAENIRLQRENEILKKATAYFREMRCEVCLDRHPAPVLRPDRNVSCAVRQRFRLPRLETRRHP